MMNIFLNIGVDWKDRILKKNLGTQQTAFVKVRDWKSEASGKGVRLSPKLFNIFNIYDEAMKAATANVDTVVKVGGYMVKSVRFADDKAVNDSTDLSTLACCP